MKIWITGASGQLGTEIRRQLDETVHRVVATDREVDITNLQGVSDYVRQEKPDVIINCAAHTAVDQCETDIESAYKINALGPKHLAIAAEEIGAKVVQVSTDYVFDGENPIPRREDDPTGPRSIYGSSKLLGEEYVKTFCKKHFIIRTAWLYGEGNNFVRTMLKLAESHDVLEVVGDQVGSPTSTKDLAKAIIRLIDTAYYGTFHGTCEGECSWYDFACKIFELKQLKITVNEVTSEAFLRPAKRPKYSVLDNFMLKLYGINCFRPWEEALAEYLKEQE